MSDEPDTTEKIVKRTEGVRVEVTSKRGTGTRDQDTVEAYAYYDTVNEAMENSDKLTKVVKERMKEARKVDEDGTVDEDTDELGSFEP